MIYLATHAKRESAPNPVHTDAGLLQICSSPFFSTIALIESYGIELVCSGSGMRFREAYHLCAETLFGVEFICSPIFGTEDSKVDGTGVMLGSGEMMPEKMYRGISEWKCIDCWKILRCLPENTIIFTGREFCKGIGIRSRSLSIYQVNAKTRYVKIIIEAGERLNNLTVDM